jgi:ABC-type branched-subunit amino acid transport system ATPase component
MVISRTFELGKPYLSMTVPENILVGAVSGHGLRGKEAGKEALDSLNLGGLKDKKDIVAAHVNLSDRRFLEVAGAPASSPLIPLFDEPIAGFNPSEIMHMLRIGFNAACWQETFSAPQNTFHKFAQTPDPPMERGDAICEMK